MTVNSEVFGSVPFVRILRNSRELPPDESGAVAKVTVRDDMEGAEAFRIDISSWSADKRDSPLLSSETWRPGQTVAIAAGYRDTNGSSQGYKLVEGMVTAVAPAISTAESAVFSVVGRGFIGALDETPRTRSFVNQTDSEIARVIAKEAGLPIDAPERAGVTDVKWDHVIQDNLTDLAFLRRRARRCGCVMTTVPSADWQERRLYFGRSPGSEPVYKFIYGKDLHHFDPTVDTSAQVDAVEVRGWSAIHGAWISQTAMRSAADFSGAMAQLDKLASPAFKNRREVLSAVVPNPEAATALARGVMTDLARRMATAEGSCAGLPRLTVGARFSVAGLKSWCDGLWVVSAVAHELGLDGYRTMFRCYRDPY